MKKLFTAALAAAFLIFGSEAAFADTPYWYPEDISAFEDYHNDNSVRIVDDADLFSDSQEAEMLEKIRLVQKDFGYDLVVYTDVQSYGLTRGVCAADFYQFGGYGLGDDYSGSVLFICMESGNRGWFSAARGQSRSYFTEDNVNDIDDLLEPHMKSGDYADGVLDYLDNIHYLYEHGRLPAKLSDYDSLFIFGIVASLILGFTYAGSAKSSMKTVRSALGATNYSVPGSFNMSRSDDIYLYTSIIRTPKPKDDDREGGGKSDYSGSFSSSGGGSFSGGGRSF